MPSGVCTVASGVLETGRQRAAGEEAAHRRMLVFLIDLWNPAEPPPESINSRSRVRRATFRGSFSLT